MPYRVLVVDDEDLARERIIRLLNEHDDVEVVGTCRDGEEAITAIQELEPDLVFIDVQMPGRNGTEVVEATRRTDLPVFVFASAFDKYALRAFELHAVEYLLKPFDSERFNHALSWAKTQIDRVREKNLSDRVGQLIDRQAAKSKYQERITVKTGDKIQIFRMDEIDWIDSAGNYASLHIRDKTYLIRITMNNLESMLNPDQFARIHRSTIVNLDRIRELRPTFHGEYLVFLKDNTQLKLSRNYRSNLLESFGQKL